ncbi:MAG: hypothetical protein JNK15_24680, partial [Planctomycetes bacterium]|nr:hypothetical protein [Planctomycetota bacterium]
RDHVDCLLQTGRTLRGRAFGPDGVLAGARVEYEVDGAVGDVAEVAPDGSFAFANLAPGPGRLLLWGQSTRLLPLAIEPNVLPDSGDIVFDLKLRPATDGSVRAEVRCGIELAGEAAELRVWQRESGRGTFAARAKEGHFHLAGLAAGFYRFEVLDAHGGHSDLGEHWLDGVGCVDLGTVVLPAPAIVEIPADAARGAVELYRRLDSVDVGAGGQFVGCQGLRLPQGSWLGVWRVGNAVHSREFTLQSGTSVALDFGN